MHELSLAVEIVQMLEAQASQLQRITRFTLDIGTLSCVDEGALRTALDSALHSTLAQDADIVVHTIEAQAQCTDCGQSFSPPTRIDPCPHCGSFRKSWLAGQDFRLRSIEGLPLPRKSHT
jgi:hydrogenase nickel incorporation protein HypA/HybF